LRQGRRTFNLLVTPKRLEESAIHSIPNLDRSPVSAGGNLERDGRRHISDSQTKQYVLDSSQGKGVDTIGTLVLQAAVVTPSSPC